MVQDSAAPYGAANLYRNSLGLSGSVWGLRSSGSKYRGQKLKNFKNKYTLETFKNKKTTATTTTKVRLRRPSGGSCRRGKEFRIQSGLVWVSAKQLACRRGVYGRCSVAYITRNSTGHDQEVFFLIF